MCRFAESCVTSEASQSKANSARRDIFRTSVSIAVNALESRAIARNVTRPALLMLEIATSAGGRSGERAWRGTSARDRANPEPECRLAS